MKATAIRRMLALLAACALTAGLLTACSSKTEDDSSQEGSDTMSSSDSLSSTEETGFRHGKHAGRIVRGDHDVGTRYDDRQWAGYAGHHDRTDRAA